MSIDNAVKALKRLDEMKAAKQKELSKAGRWKEALRLHYNRNGIQQAIRVLEKLKGGRIDVV